MNINAIATNPSWPVSGTLKSRVQAQPAAAPALPDTSIPLAEARLAGAVRFPVLESDVALSLQPASVSEPLPTGQNAMAFGDRLQKLCSMAYGSAMSLASDALAENTKPILQTAHDASNT